MGNGAAAGLAARQVKVLAGMLLLLAGVNALGESRLLTSIEEVFALKNEEANAGIPVHVQATVSYYDHQRYSLIISSGGRNVRINTDWRKAELPIRAGDRVAVDGFTTRGAFRVAVASRQISVIGHGPAPAPQKVSLSEAIEPFRNSAYIESEGQVVLAQAGERLTNEVAYTVVRLRSKDVTVDLSVHAPADVSMRSWLGRRMRFRGVSGGLYNSRSQRYQAIVYVRSLQDLSLVDAVAAPSVGESSPLPLASLFQFNREMPAVVRTSGIVTYVHARNGFYMQDGNSGIRVRPAHPVDLAPGDQVEVIGRPEWGEPGQSILSGALVTPQGRHSSVEAQRYHLNHIDLPATEALLTSWEGVVADQSSEGWRESLTLRPVVLNRAELPTFQCVYFHDDSGAYLSKYETGSRLRVVGVLELEWSANHFRPVSAQMLIRSPRDITLLAGPPWQSRVPWLQLFGFFVLALTGAMAWVWTLRRRVATQTADLSRALVLAEAASRAKSEFLANVSHEIRTPMNGIMGMTEMVLAGALTVDQRSFLQTAYGSAKILLAILNDILDSSKIQAGKMTIESVELSLPRTISAALSPFGSLAFGKGIELACDLAPDLPNLVLGDPVRISQIIANLVSNAMKFTESGEVVVCARLIDRRAGADGSALEIEVSVRDTGIGIPRESQHLLFQSFTQTHDSMARRFGGTGLGLAISSRLAQAMGGRMWVESEPGVGSTFFFTMQLKQSRGGVAAAGPETRLRGLRVLVVDDHPTSLRLLARSLSSLGVEHSGANSGTGALEILKSSGERFDFIIADHHMPRMTGSRFLQIARDECLIGQNRTLLLCSGAAPEGNSHAARVVLKPLAAFELGEALAGLLDDEDRTRSPSPALAKIGAPPEKERLRILVAEDNEDSQFLMKMYMKRGGYDAVVVENGKEAIAAWESSEFSLILMDGHMPEMDGLQATAAIRERERGWRHSIPIIAITAFSDDGDRERFLNAGMTEYLTKPVSYADLVNAIERHRYPATAA